MSRMVTILLLAICLNTITHIEASDFGKLINKISTTVSKIKSQLFEYFHRFRVFFTRHTESTHHLMTARGCGYAVDDEPMIYNKRAKIVSKIKGGDDAIWHT
ncbi:unnamed protein product, partial [Rotaria magnacalcarata]